MHTLTSLIFCLIQIKQPEQNLQTSTRILTLLTMARDEENGARTGVEGCACWDFLLSKFKRFDCCRVNNAKQILDHRKPYVNWISLILCVTSISIDPLFFYIPMISSLCLDLDGKLAIIAFILRSAVDLIYVWFQWQPDGNNSAFCYWLFRQYFSYRKKEGYIHLLAVLPLPQVVIIAIVLSDGSIKYYDAMNVLKYFVYIQFVPRVIRIYPLLRKATGTFDILGEVSWAKAAFNLYLYLLSGHVFGALWYFFGIERAIQCWEEHTHKDYKYFGCDSRRLSSDTLEHLNIFCSTKTENKTLAYNFGIYQAVLEPEVTKEEFLPRIMYCVRWGLQSLSCFGQNLITSIDIWENIFTITITIASLVLFVFFIGNMQLYIQSGTSKLEETKLKMREIKHWKPYKSIPENLQQQVNKQQLYVWQETKGVDAENFLNNLPKDLRRSIKSELCLKLLKKVPNFKSISDQRLNAMCERLKFMLYSKEIYIVRKKEPVDEMLFIISGELLIDGSSNDSDENFVEDKSDFYGDELSTWAQDRPSSSNLPISTKNVKTVTEVEAFALSADDLKDVFTQFK